MKNKIIEILKREMYNVCLEEGGIVNVVEEDDFNDIAERIVKLFAIPNVSKRCSHCLYRKYRPNARYRYEKNSCQISGHNLTDVENYSCEHYKPIPNVC